MYDGQYKAGIFYPDINKDERYTLGELTHKILDDMDILPSSLKDYRIIYVAHFLTAEWAMLKDRDSIVVKLEYIRKSLITTKRSLKTTIIDESGDSVSLWVDFRDTMLLLPESYKSLDKASTFIEGYEKLEVSDYYKSHMYQFLQDDPVAFETYAIRDAEVTFKLFIKLQFLLNEINGTESKLFTTLASATISHFEQFAKDTFGKNVKKMQFNRFHSLYKQYESLVDRSYMGGLNSSYHIGESRGYTFCDIDFKNAYPTAMNLLRVGDFGLPITKATKNSYKVDLDGLSA